MSKIRETNRYLNAYNGQAAAMKEKDLPEDEFMIFREYVRLLRSCTIMCGKDVSEKFKEIFVDFFFGTRIELAVKLREAS